MTRTNLIDRLAAISRRFGSDHARKKLLLLGEIASLQRHASRRLVLLHETLSFMRAYPDSPAVLDAVRNASDALRETVERHVGGDVEHPSLFNSGLPATSNSYVYSYGVLQRLSELFPGCLRVDWDEVGETPPIVDAINLTVAPGESRGLEDEFQDLRDWLQENARTGQTDIEVILDLFRRSGLTPRQQMHVFETCGVPVVFRMSERGSARCEVARPPERIHYQRRPVPAERFPLKPRIVGPPGAHRGLDRREGRAMLDLALVALSGRNLEIQPLIYGDPGDVTVIEGGRGIEIVLAGMVPEFRQVLESDFFFLIVKNGVPVAYGPASVFLGCCEMGINLFSEYRGGEIRYIYSQLMNALYHLAGVRYFFLTSYGMGDGNPDALKSGAFWFYRKLGFRAADPDVEALAREQEAIMRRRPRYRCPMPVLRELSYTDAYLDLSRGACRPLNFESLGHAVSRFIVEEFAGDRRRATRACVRRLVAALGVGDRRGWSGAERAALERLAPVLVIIDGLERWPASDKRRLVAAIRARGGKRETDYIRCLQRVPRIAGALHAVVRSRETAAGR